MPSGDGHWTGPSSPSLVCCALGHDPLGPGPAPKTFPLHTKVFMASPSHLQTHLSSKRQSLKNASQCYFLLSVLKFWLPINILWGLRLVENNLQKLRKNLSHCASEPSGSSEPSLVHCRICTTGTAGHFSVPNTGEQWTDTSLASPRPLLGQRVPLLCLKGRRSTDIAWLSVRSSRATGPGRVRGETVSAVHSVGSQGEPWEESVSLPFAIPGHAPRPRTPPCTARAGGTGDRKERLSLAPQGARP